VPPLLDGPVRRRSGARHCGSRAARKGIAGLTTDDRGALGAGLGLQRDGRHDRVHNRIDAEFGAIALAGGFTFQAIGYVALLLGVDSATGGVETLVAVALALSAGVGVLLAGAV
jgi:hypothetical protein